MTSDPVLPDPEAATPEIVNLPDWPCDSCWGGLARHGLHPGEPWRAFTLGETFALSGLVCPRRARIDAFWRRTSAVLVPRLREIAERPCPDPEGSEPGLFVLCADCRTVLGEWTDEHRVPAVFVGPRMAGRLALYAEIKRGRLEKADEAEAYALWVQLLDVTLELGGGGPPAQAPRPPWR